MYEDWKLAAILCTSFVLLVAIITLGIYANNRAAFECGYERSTLQGSSSSCWVKVPEGK